MSQSQPSCPTAAVTPCSPGGWQMLSSATGTLDAGWTNRRYGWEDTDQASSRRLYACSQNCHMKSRSIYMYMYTCIYSTYMYTKRMTGTRYSISFYKQHRKKRNTITGTCTLYLEYMQSRICGCTCINVYVHVCVYKCAICWTHGGAPMEVRCRKRSGCLA